MTIRTEVSNTVIEHFNIEGIVVESKIISGTAHRILPFGTEFVIVTIQNRPIMTLHSPNNDTDGDGVDNSKDAFPMDAAASIDNDGDGYPDI